MTKRIVFAVMCVLLLLVIVMSCIVFNRFRPVLELLWSSSAPTEPTTMPVVTEPSQPTVPPETTQPTEATQPTETTAPTEPTAPTETTAPTEPVHQHTYVKLRTAEPTCTSYGYTVYACDCGKTEIPTEEMIDPVGHSYVAGDPVKATCTTAGYIPYTCANCEDRYASKTEEPLGHTFGPGKVNLPSCEEDGYTAFTCVVCKHEEKESVVEAFGHTFEVWEVVQEATDVRPGIEKSICTVCEGEGTRQILPTGELKITNGNGNGQVATKVDADGKQYRHYIIMVGTDAHPNAYTYSISYHVAGGVMKYTYSQEGLLVMYQDKDGRDLQILLDPYRDNNLEIFADSGTGDGPDDPTQPTEPTDPTQPTGSTEPTQPSETTDPTQPTVPSDPSRPTESTDPTQPTEPADPTQPTEPTNPTQPSGTTEPTQPTTPSAPTQPTEPSDPVTQPTEPSESATQPTQPAASTQATDAT